MRVACQSVACVRSGQRFLCNRNSRRKGFVLIATSACIFLLLAVIGLAFDLGRIYIARNEGQVFVDAAAMAASAELDGTATGLVRADAALVHLSTRWNRTGYGNMAARNIEGAIVEFSADGNIWEQKPREAVGVRYARVTAPDNHTDITFLHAVGGPASFNTPVYAVASAPPVRLIE